MYKMFFGTNFEAAHGAIEDYRAVARLLNEEYYCLCVSNVENTLFYDFSVIFKN